tara:strand:- start:1 stop:300 length:300 start_codon:yes stop_codon:yes gene_type:complete
MKRNNVTKKDLKNQINYNFGIPDSLSEQIINSILDTIIDGLIRDNEVKISKFGTLKILNKKQRVGRNPKTKEEFNINKRKVVTFYPSLYIKNILNEKKE